MPPAEIAAPGAGASPAGRSWLLAVAALTVLGFAVRAWGFGQSLLGDELFAFAEIRGRGLAEVVGEVRDGVEVSPPLYFVLAWATAKLGDPTVWIRLPSLLLGTALVPLTFVFGRATVGRAAGLCGAALIAVGPFAIFYADEARPYASLSALAAVSSLVLLRATRDGGRWWWIAYAVSVAAVVYTHYTGVFVVIAQTAWALWLHRERIGGLAAATAGAFVLFLPWLPFVGGKGQLDVYGPFELRLATLAVPLRVLAGHPFIPLRDTPGVAALVVAGLVCLVALGFVLSGRGRQASGSRAALLLVAGLALATPIGMLAASVVTGSDLLTARNLSASLPAAALLVGRLLTAPPKGVAIALAAVAVLAVGVGGAMTLASDRQRPDARAAARFIDARAAPGDTVVFLAPTDSTSNRPLEPYLQRTDPSVFGSAQQYQAAFERAARSRTAVIVAFPAIPAIVSLIAPPEALARRFRLDQDARFPGFGGGIGVRVFAPR